MATKKKSSSSGYVTGTLNGMKQTFTSADVAKQYGAKLDSSPNKSQISNSVRVSNQSIEASKNLDPNPPANPGGLTYNGKVMSGPLAEIKADVPETKNIPVSEISPTQALQLPQMSTDTAAADGMASMANTAVTGIEKYMKELTPPETEASKKESALQKSLDKLLDSSAGQTETLIKEENRLGLPKLQADLADLNSQILTKSAAYDQQYNKQSNELAPMSSIIGKQRAVRDAEGAEIGFLTARALGLQGQIDAAKETAKRAVELKYAPILEQIDIKTKQLAILQPILDKEERKFAAALELKLADDRERKIEEKEKAKTNLSYAIEQGVKTRYGNKNGEFFDVNTGQGFKTPQEFFKAAGVSSFEEAYQRNLITDVNMDKISERGMVARMAEEYPDAGIRPDMTVDQAGALLGKSRIYREKTRPPQYASGNTTTIPTGIVSKEVDARVAQIIASNPGEYGNAANQIDFEFGAGTATKYDNWLRRVYNHGQNIDDVASGKAPTQDNYTSSGFAGRLNESNSALEKVSNKIVGMDYLTYKANDKLPSQYQSEEFRQYKQAVTNFITAKLRKESGAQIAPTEFEDAYKVYIPQPGDDPTTLNNKARVRQQAIRDMSAQAGNALQIPSSQPQSSSAQVGSIIEYQGKRYKVIDAQGNLQEI